MRKIWREIVRRCTKPKDPAYPNYGGRGINVSDEWLDFETFRRDMGPRPSSAHSVERQNNHLGYSKSNCVWATRLEQSRNKRTNRLLTLGSETMCLAAWSERTGIKRATIAMRLTLGWSVERALTEPVGPVRSTA